MPIRQLLTTLLLLPLPSFAGAGEVLVVCPEAWRPAAREWVQHRQGQGHTVVFAAPGDSPEATFSAIQDASSDEGPRWLAIIGDVDAKGGGGAPAWLVDAKVNPRWGSEPTIATDLPYGDLDGDGVAEVAVGRIPVDTPDQLRDYLARVIAFEQRRDGDLDENRMTVVASPGRFSPILDRVIEATAFRILTQLTPPSCDLHFTYADWRSRFCPYPPRMPVAIQESLQQRSLAWIYLGHAHRHTLDLLQTPLGHARLLDRELVGSLKGEQYPPLAAIVACYAGAFDGADDCLAEDLLRQPGGPLVVLAGSRVTMPYGNSALGLELLDGIFGDSPTTAGELISRAKARTLVDEPRAQRPESAALRKTVELVAAGFTPAEEDRQRERLEHAQMYNLLGDPLLQLRRPTPLALQALLSDDRRSLTIDAESPIDGNCRLRLVAPWAPRSMTAEGRDELTLNNQTATDYAREYDAANNRAVAEETLEVAAGKLCGVLSLPPGASGKLLVVADIAGPEGLASGHVAVEIPAPDAAADVASPPESPQADTG